MRGLDAVVEEIADQIGAPIKPGTCEIFPDDYKGIGHGIRAPGTWNPKSGDCGLILRETLTRLLPGELPAGSPKESNCFQELGNDEGRISASSPIVTFSCITAPGTRHAKLSELIGAFIPSIWQRNQFGNKLSSNTRELVPSDALLNEQLLNLTRHGQDERQRPQKIEPGERIKIDALTTDNEPDAFPNLAELVTDRFTGFLCSRPDFGRAAWYEIVSWCRQKMGVRNSASLGILRKTADYVPHKLAARYQWIADK